MSELRRVPAGDERDDRFTRQRMVEYAGVHHRGGRLAGPSLRDRYRQKMILPPEFVDPLKSLHVTKLTDRGPVIKWPERRLNRRVRVIGVGILPDERVVGVSRAGTPAVAR